MASYRAGIALIIKTARRNAARSGAKRHRHRGAREICNHRAIDIMTYHIAAIRVYRASSHLLSALAAAITIKSGTAWRRRKQSKPYRKQR